MVYSKRLHFKLYIQTLLILVFSVSLFGCGGEGATDPVSDPIPTSTNTLGLATLSVNGATLDQVFQSNQLGYTVTVGFITNSINITATTVNANETITVNGVDIGVGGNSQSVPLAEGVNPAISIIVTAADSTTAIYTLTVTRQAAAAFAQQAYIKASNTDADDRFGQDVSLSGDGNTLAVGAFREESIATGINGDESDNSAGNLVDGGTGAIYVFTRSGSSWNQQAYIKPDGTLFPKSFGWSVSLSKDGNTLAVGDFAENSNATGINGNATGTIIQAGAVHVFSRNGSSWSQQAYIKGSNTDGSDRFGWSVSLSDTGNTLAVSAPWESSLATGVNGDESSNFGTQSGAAYVFTRTGSNWNQQAYIKASTIGTLNHFGHSLSLSGDGNTLAIGAQDEDNSATGINGDENNGLKENSGAAYVFTRAGSSWSQQAYIKASNTDANDKFGSDLSLNDDGDTLVVGAHFEASNATGVNGDENNNNSLGGSGAAYIFVRSSGNWSHQAYAKPSNTVGWFGSAVSLSGDGSALVVGAWAEGSGATGINGDESQTSFFSNAGAAYLFIREGSSWSQQAYIKASNTQSGDGFGSAVSLSGDGGTLAVGAANEDSNATGINGDDSDNSKPSSGATYLY